jgi:hypothetical protein
MTNKTAVAGRTKTMMVKIATTNTQSAFHIQT